jgi:hypothetical protein
MGSYDAFEATHRVVATSDDAVASCKRTLASQLSERATEFRVFVHSTEWADAPGAVTALSGADPEKAEFAGDQKVLKNAFPDAEQIVEAVFAEMDDAGGFPVSALGFVGDGFAALLTASTSHLHVGKFRCNDSALADELSDALDGCADRDTESRARVGVVVPAGPSVGWEHDDTSLELDGPKLCVYDEQPASLEERATTSHTCHDLTRLTAMDADAADGRIELAWRDPVSVVGRGMQLVFGWPPTELHPPDEMFDAVESYPDPVIADSR